MTMCKGNGERCEALVRDKGVGVGEKNIHGPATVHPEGGMASFCPFNIGPGKCFPSTFYRRINAGDRKGACEAIRWWIKDGGRDCRIRSNNCYGQVSRRDQESALACWGIDR
ncbi:lysozyme, partial [Escherichia coli]|uniref:glycoside hydrolase family protein n=1 Tax=Escherichia coli TaxID=562 RepID=UPI000B3F2316